MRVQRTRSAASPPHSLLTRWPSGGIEKQPANRVRGWGLLLCLNVLWTACASAPVLQNLVVWNQTDVPERISLAVDQVAIYNGILGTIDSFPRIVIQRSLAFPAGRHVFSVAVPGRQFTRTLEFDVGDKPVNLHVMVNQGAVEVGVTYGNEAYL
jgi:hypothetical protein